MVLRIGFISIAIFTLLACDSGTKSCENCDETTVVSGQSLFADKCISCHGADGKLGNSGASDLSKSTMSVEEIRHILNEGQGAMPPMLELVEKPKYMDSVVEYIQTLRKK